MNARLPRGVATLANSVLVWAAIAAVSFPMFWALLTSAKLKSDTMSFPITFWPERLTLDAYRQLLFETQFPRLFLNSLYVSCGTTLLVLVVGSLGAYGLTRFRFPGRDLGAGVILFTYFLPSTVIVIPIYLTIKDIGLADTLNGLILAYTILALPFALWLLRLFFQTLPREIEDAARVDGASRLALLLEIILPQTVPGLISAGLFTFIIAYNEYLFAFIFIRSQAHLTLPVGVMQITKMSFEVQWNQLMAASVLMTIPVLAVIISCQRYLLSGFSVGGVKG